MQNIPMNLQFRMRSLISKPVHCSWTAAHGSRMLSVEVICSLTMTIKMISRIQLCNSYEKGTVGFSLSFLWSSGCSFFCDVTHRTEIEMEMFRYFRCISPLFFGGIDSSTRLELETETRSISQANGRLRRPTVNFWTGRR